jgi:hypothetical protein
MQTPVSKRKYLLTMIPFIVLFAVVSYVTLTWRQPSPGDPSPVDTDLRGGRILILRLPSTTAPRQQIEIFSDGHASRVPVFLTWTDYAQQIELAAGAWHAVDTLRSNWCAHPPTVRPIRPQEPSYEIGLRCGDFDYQRVQIPIDTLPAALARLLTQASSVP